MNEQEIAQLAQETVSQLKGKLIPALNETLNGFSETMNGFSEKLTSLGNSVDAVMGLMGQDAGADGEDKPTLIDSIADAVYQRLEITHAPGFCNETECEGCREQKHDIAVEVLNHIEEKVPGTKAALHQWEYMNSPVTIGDGGN
jgi:hypothetical protein